MYPTRGDTKVVAWKTAKVYLASETADRYTETPSRTGDTLEIEMKKIALAVVGLLLLAGAGNAGMLRTDTETSIPGQAIHSVDTWFNNLIDVDRINRYISR